MNALHFAQVVSLALSLAACATSALDAKSAHDAGEGTARVFEGTPQDLWTAGHAVMKWNPVGAVANHEAEHYFVTDASDFDQIGIWVEPAGPGKSRVTVVVIDDPNLPGPNEQGVLKDIGTALTLARNGQSAEKRP
ncbi:MAG TPA: hypothetical protein VF765_02610 [Polyangiaceae bacterium]